MPSGPEPSRPLTAPELATLVAFLLLSAGLLLALAPSPTQEPSYFPPAAASLPALHFDGGVANLTVWAQERMGPRLPGSENASALRAYLNASLTRYGWNVSAQPFLIEGEGSPLHNTTLTNLIAKRGPDRPAPAGSANATNASAPGPLYMLAAHYDTRPVNNEEESDPAKQVPIPGANDGGSGVAVLLELARVLAPANLTAEVWLLFFDAEDYPGAMFSGSKYFAANLNQTTVERTKAFVLLDMVGDNDLNLPRERYSDAALLDELYGLAATLDQTAFRNRPGHYVMDDHRPLQALGIKAVDLIDFDYGGPGPGGPYWHTLADTRDKVSAASLESVGRVVEAWLRLKATGSAPGSEEREGPPPSPAPPLLELNVTTEATLGPGLYAVGNLSVGPGATLTLTNATLAFYGNLSVAGGGRLALVDSILAGADTPGGHLPTERVVVTQGGVVEVLRSEWHGPPLG